MPNDNYLLSMEIFYIEITIFSFILLILNSYFYFANFTLHFIKVWIKIKIMKNYSFVLKLHIYIFNRFSNKFIHSFHFKSFFFFLFFRVKRRYPTIYNRDDRRLRLNLLQYATLFFS